MIDLTPVLNAVLMLISVIITAYLIPLIKSQTNKQEQQQINEWVKIAVSAAEQIYLGIGMGEKKKQFVLDFLLNKNMTLSFDELDKMIEAAVLEINKGVL